VIIDEAHNIESQAEEGQSIKMDILNLDKAEADLQ
jgi:Rad3-related DNA helicase